MIFTLLLAWTKLIAGSDETIIALMMEAVRISESTSMRLYGAIFQQRLSSCGPLVRGC
jgi:hypothetical protein